MPGPPRVVLVHGAWHGAWCWERVADGLARAGVEAIVPDLPGHGSDPEPLGDLHGDAAAVGEVLDAQPMPVVLVGHSYGGAVVTEAGDHPAVAHVVYLAAFPLDAGETCMTAAAGHVATGEAGGVVGDAGVPAAEADLVAGFLPGPGDTITLEPGVAAAALYNRCDPETVAWAVSRLGPQPMVTLQQEPRTVAWRTRPSTYVVCTDDMIVPPALQRMLARRCTQSVEWDTDHSPFLCRPELVVDLLTSLTGPGG